ncbi:hypothetical protein D3C85_1635710 [compost metagenome]
MILLFQDIVDYRPAGIIYPNFVPFLQIRISIVIQNGNQVRPGSVAIGKLLQVLPYSLLKFVFTHQAFQLPHHDWRLMVNDIAIQRTGIF